MGTSNKGYLGLFSGYSGNLRLPGTAVGIGGYFESGGGVNVVGVSAGLSLLGGAGGLKYYSYGVGNNSSGRFNGFTLFDYSMYAARRVLITVTSATLTSVVAALMGGGFLAAANMLGIMMVGRVNERSPEGKRASYLWWTVDIRRRYKELYADGTLVFWQNVCFACAVVSFVVAIAIEH